MPKTKKPTKPRAPAHLKPATKAWFASVVADFDFEQHHVRLLTLAAEAWDRCQQAREVLEQEGLTFTHKGNIKPRPEVAIERDSRIAFARLLRELSLDVSPPSDYGRPPQLPANARLKVRG